MLIALFSQYLTKIKIPFPGYSKERRECYVGHYPLFRLFPVSVMYRGLVSAIRAKVKGTIKHDL